MSVLDFLTKSNKLRPDLYVVEVASDYFTVYHGGVLLREPTLIAVKRDNGLVPVAVGRDVYTLRRDNTGTVSVISPIEDGVVVNKEAATLMISEFMGKIIPQKLFKRARMVIAVPCGITPVERETLESVFIKAGYKDVISTELLCGLKPVMPEQGALAIIFGSDTTEIGILNKRNIISGCSLNIAGKTINEKIADVVSSMGSVKISIGVIEKLRIEIGSLFDGDTTIAKVQGYDILDDSPKKVDISSANIKPAIAYCYDKFLDVAESLLTTVPIQIKDEIIAGGIYLAGSGATIQGLQEHVSKRIHMSSRVVREPELAPLQGLYEQGVSN